MRTVAVALLLAACGPPETAVRVGVDLEPGLAVRQLSFSGTAVGALVFGPELRPDSASEVPLESGGELVVLLPDRLHGRELTCSVSAYESDVMVAWSQSVTVVRRGEEVGCRVFLRKAAAPPRPGCTGCIDSSGRCVSGDDDDACGSGGAACRSCGGDGDHCRSRRCDD